VDIEENCERFAASTKRNFLSFKENQQDYQRRIPAWFGHYLKGEPAETWITDGQSFIEREAEIKRLKNKQR
jgi:hypothetical protein